MLFAQKYCPIILTMTMCIGKAAGKLSTGFPYAMSPMPSPKHQRVSANLNFLLVQALRNSGHTKFDIYQSQKVRYYLIVDADRELVEIYECVNGKYLRRELPGNEKAGFNFDDACVISVDLNDIWK